MRWFFELLAIAEGLYWLIGVFIVLGGLVIFLGETIGVVVTRRRTKREIPPWAVVDRGPTYVSHPIDEPDRELPGRAAEELPAPRLELPPGEEETR